MADQYVGHAEIAAFADEKVNLKRDDVKEFREQVARLRENLEKRISEDSGFALLKMLHSGSVAKGTALRTLNDMDVAVYLKSEAAPGDEAGLVNWLVDRLREAYPQIATDKIQPATHCARVSFSGSGLDVDVVPVLYEGGDDDRGYLVVKDTGVRVLTSIPLHLKFVRSRKETWPPHYAQVVRLAKWWVRTQKQRRVDFSFKSFLVELLVAYVGEHGVQFSNYCDALERVFAFIVKSELRERIAFTDYYDSSELPASSSSPVEIYDPVNPDNNAAAQYSDADRLTVVEAANDAVDALTEARYATTKGRALDLWKEVLGSSFGA